MTYCPRCLKQHLQPDSVHTCTPHPAAQEIERLRKALRFISALIPGAAAEHAPRVAKEALEVGK